MAAAALPRRSFLDYPLTRLVALLIALALGLAIWQSWRHRPADSLPVRAQPIGEATSMSPALAECLRQRHAAIDDMRANNVIGAGQVAAFKARADNLCEQTTRPTR